MKVLLTGGAGFIGRRLASRLAKQGAHPVVLDPFAPQVHPDREASLREVTSVADVVEGDVNNASLLSQLIERVEVVVHLAAETGVGQSQYETQRYTHTNVCGMAAVRDALLRAGDSVARLVVASSRAVYGEGRYHCARCGDVIPSRRSREQLEAGKWEPRCPQCGAEATALNMSEDDPLRPTSVYGWTKLAQEDLSRLWDPARCLIFRLFNVYGPGQPPANPYTGIIARFGSRALAGSEIALFEGGGPTRDFVYVDDVVNVLARGVMEQWQGTVNVGSGQRMSLIELAEQINGIGGERSKVAITDQFRIGDVRHGCADIRRLRELCPDYSPTSAKAGLTETLLWMQKLDLATISDRDLDELNRFKLV